MHNHVFIALLLLAALASGPVQARPHAGFSGLTAAADNAGTAGSNPAGITRLEGSSSRLELMTIYSRSTWEGQLGESGPPFKSSDSGTLVVPVIYLVKPLSEKLSFGFTILGVGLADDFGDWPGRYFVTSYDSLNVSAFPSLAYRVTDKLSLGASLALTYSSYEQERAIANIFDPGFEDGYAELESDGLDLGFSLSALYEITDRTRWGLMYQSGSDPTLEGKVKYRGLGPNTEAVLDEAGFIGADVEVKSKTPQSVLAGLYHEFNNRHALTLDVAWLEFSEFQLSEFYFDGEGLAGNETDYQDIWAVSAGYSWPLNDRWMLGVSGLYIDDMVKDDDRTATLRLDSIWSLAVAAEWQWRDRRQVFVSFSYMEPGDAPVTTPSIPGIGSAVGKYTERETYLLSVGVKFGGR